MSKALLTVVLQREIRGQVRGKAGTGHAPRAVRQACLVRQPYCLVEIFATIQAGKGIVFRGACVGEVLTRRVSLLGTAGGAQELIKAGADGLEEKKN